MAKTSRRMSWGLWSATYSEVALMTLGLQGLQGLKGFKLLFGPLGLKASRFGA